MARHTRWRWPWRRKRQPGQLGPAANWPPAQPDQPTWATEQTDAHPWATAPTAYQPLVEWDAGITRPYVIRECGDIR